MAKDIHKNALYMFNIQPADFFQILELYFGGRHLVLKHFLASVKVANLLLSGLEGFDFNLRHLKIFILQGFFNDVIMVGNP